MNKDKFFFQFGGQGGGYFQELKRLYLKEPLLKDFFNHCFEALFESKDIIDSSSVYPLGLKFAEWLQGTDTPEDSYLQNYPVSLPGIFITQVGYFELLKKSGFPVKEIFQNISGSQALGGLAGHSQGICAAALLSISPHGDKYYSGLKKFIKFFILSSIHLDRVFTKASLKDSKNFHLETEPGSQSPMAAISGIDYKLLKKNISDYNNKNTKDNLEDKIFLGLKNSASSFVLVGKEKTLAQFQTLNKVLWEQNNVRWSYLDITIPFHCQELLGTAIEPFSRDLKKINFDYTLRDLKIPVYSTFDGCDLSQNGEKNYLPDAGLGDVLFQLVFLKVLDWQLSVARIFKGDISHIIDFGPGKISMKLTQSLVKDENIPILSAISKSDRKILLSNFNYLRS